MSDDTPPSGLWTVIEHALKLYITACPTCGITYALPSHLDDFMRADNTMKKYCPNGHPTVYSNLKSRQQLESELETLRKEVTSLRTENVRLLAENDQIRAKSEG